MRTISLLFLLVMAVAGYSDMPGNRPRPSAEVTIENQLKWPEYTFLYSLDYYEGVTEGDTLKAGESMLLPGGYGAPPTGAIWAVHRNGKATQPIFFSNEEANMTVIIDTIIGDSILYSATTSTVPVPEENISEPQSYNAARELFTRKMFIWISGTALLAFLFIFIAVMTRKTKKP